MGPMLAPWILLSGMLIARHKWHICHSYITQTCYYYCTLLFISAGAVSAEKYHAWNLDLDVGAISDNLTHTCANLQPPSDNGLLIMNTSDFTELRVLLLVTNLAVNPIDCHSNPLLFLMNGVTKSMASDECRPLCGHPANCLFEENFKEFTVWHCVCPGGSCNQIALGISSGAFIDKAMPAKICTVDIIYIWDVLRDLNQKGWGPSLWGMEGICIQINSKSIWQVKCYKHEIL